MLTMMVEQTAVRFHVGGNGVLAGEAPVLQSASRRWSLDDYADMLVRSTLTEAHNTGAVLRYTENGVGYARVIERDTACKICRPMDDKIIWLGNPKLRPGYHPRCRGGIAPVLGVPDNPILSPDDPRIPQTTREAMLRK